MPIQARRRRLLPACSIGRSGSGTHGRCGCTTISSGCGATIRCLGCRAPAASTARSSANSFFFLGFSGPAAGDRLLFVNLGLAFAPPVLAEPLVAPPAGKCWRLLWSSEAPAYGGSGIREAESAGLWHISGHCAIVVTSE